MPTLEAALRAHEGVVNVKEYGAIGDNTNDDTAEIQAAADAAFGTAASPNGLNLAYNNKVLYFPPGRYKISAPITFTKLCGGRITGAGRFVTSIQNVTANSNVFTTNGCARSRWEGLSLTGSGTATIFDLNWDGDSTNANALQSNSFHDMDFNGGAYGINAGAGGYMGSENLVSNCFFTGHTTAGFNTANYNALQNTIIGGNMQSCGNGARVGAGSISAIISTGFQICTYDVAVNNSANDTILIDGCRSESDNFGYFNNGISVHMRGIIMTSSVAGDLIVTNSGCPVTIENCVTQNARINLGGGHGRMVIRNSAFGRDDWLNAAANQAAGCQILIEMVKTGKTWVDTGTGTAAYILHQKRTASGTYNFPTA